VFSVPCEARTRDDVYIVKGVVLHVIGWLLNVKWCRCSVDPIMCCLWLALAR
jgi:hypothetical protein